MVRNTANESYLNQNVPNPFYIGNYPGLQQSDPLLYQRLSNVTLFSSQIIQRQRLLRANPAATNLSNEVAPLARARTHSFEANFERRLSKGFNLNASYVWMKSDKWDTIFNEFEREPNQWTPTQNARPHRITMSGIYELPFGRGRAFLNQGILNHLLGGWQMAGTYEWQQGPMLEWGNLIYKGDLNNIEEDLKSGEKSLNRWFNTTNFERDPNKLLAGYHVRVFPTRIYGVRADGTNFLSGNLQREFAFKERVRFQIRADVVNVLNRSTFNGPNMDPASTNFGVVTSRTASNNRFLQFQGRIRF